MNDAILMMNANPASKSWDLLPKDLWQAIVKSLPAWGIDGFGLDGVKTREDLSKFPVFLGWNREPSALVTHRRYEGKVNDATVAIWPLDVEAIQIIADSGSRAWTTSNDLYPTDEVLFFRGAEERIQAIGYEDMIFFHRIGESDLRFFDTVDPRIRLNLVDPTGHPFRTH